MRLLLLLPVLFAATAGGATWDWPVTGPHAIVRPYVAPPTPYGAGHRGVDLASGTELRAPADGVVHFAGVVVDRGVLSIDHGGGVLSSYEPVTTDLVAGDVVRRGDVIATIDPGHCSEPCVHLGVRVDGEYVSPLLYLGGVPRAVLLPTRSLSAPAGTRWLRRSLSDRLETTPTGDWVSRRRWRASSTSDADYTRSTSDAHYARGCASA
jgi:murein DD-endopeptidase MepM/ murein hydrolase activator NlpD